MGVFGIDDDSPFEMDGGLLSIYIYGTDLQDWQMLFTFLHQSTCAFDFKVMGELQLLPERPEDVFAIAQRGDTAILRVDELGLALHCHFFTTTEIEFDLNPRNFQTGQQVRKLRTFMNTLSLLLKKDVLLQG